MLSNLKAVGRTLLGALVLAATWFLVGWGWASLQLGLAMALVSLLLAPLAMPVCSWLFFRFRRVASLQRFNVRPDTLLSHAYLRSLLRQPGPRPRLWVLFSREVFCFWFERSLMGPGRQVLIVSSAWLAQDQAQKERDWQLLWARIAAMSAFERRLRSVQIALWLGALLPAEVLALLLRVLLRIAAFRELPQPAFWLHRWAWLLREVWFGLPPERHLQLRAERGLTPRRPRVWNSLLWSTWVLVPLRHAHPLWPLFSHAENFLAAPPETAASK